MTLFTEIEELIRSGETLYDWAKWMKQMKNYATLARVIRANS